MKQKLLKFIGNTFVKGGALLFITGLLGSFLNYLFNLIAAKRLGPAGYGEIVALFSYAVVFSVPLSVIVTEIIKRLGKYEGNKLEKIREWESWGVAKLHRYRLLFIVYAALIIIFPSLTNLSVPAVATLLAFLVLAIIYSFYQGALQGAHLFLLFAFISLISPLIKFAGAVILFVPHTSIIFIYIFLLISYIVPIIIVRWYIKNKVTNKLTPGGNQRIFSLLLSRSMLLTIFSLIGITLVSNLDIMYVKKFFPSTQSGIYGAWTIFAKIVFFIIGPVQNISLIFFSSRNQKKNHIIALLLFLLGILFIAICLHLVYSIFGDQVLALLFSKEYLPVVPLLRYAAVFGFLYASIVILNNFFLAKNSPASLITTIAIPIYALLLYFFGTSLERVVFINIFLTAVILVLSLSVLIKMAVFKPLV